MPFNDFTSLYPSSTLVADDPKVVMIIFRNQLEKELMRINKLLEDA